MKIIKVNDHQIRCTLTPKDLEKRQLKINEIAYGTDKVKALFRDMMRQASFEFGFEAEDIPLMIEAIPFAECVVIIITKVEDPEELDTRFSKFAPSVHTHEEDDEEDEEDTEDSSLSNASDFIDLFRRMSELTGSNLSNEIKEAEAASSVPEGKQESESISHDSVYKIFIFHSLYEITPIAKMIDHSFRGESSLYSNKSDCNYLLVISQGSLTDVEFTKVYNTLTEYAAIWKSHSASKAYLEEHYEPILAENAVHTLAALN